MQTEIDGRGLRLILFLFGMMCRKIYVKLNAAVPDYVTPQGLDLQPGDLKNLLQDVEEKRVRVVLDPASPFTFDKDCFFFNAML